MESAMDQKIIEKLQKLLALSGSDNEHEADMAMRKAEELMREHNLSVADVALNGSGAHVNSADVVGLTKSSQKWEMFLGTSIAKTFNGAAIRCRSAQGWKFTFVAGRTDLELIVDLYERLRRTIRRMSDAYVSSSAHPGLVAPRTLHNSYRLGMIPIISKRLKQLQENTAPKDDTRNTYGMTGRELMIVKDRAVEQRVNKLFPRVKTTHAKASSVEGSAYRQGQNDGRNVSLHRSVHGSHGPVTIGR